MNAVGQQPPVFLSLKSQNVCEMLLRLSLNQKVSDQVMKVKTKFVLCPELLCDSLSTSINPIGFKTASVIQLQCENPPRRLLQNSAVERFSALKRAFSDRLAWIWSRPSGMMKVSEPQHTGRRPHVRRPVRIRRMAPLPGGTFPRPRRGASMFRLRPGSGLFGRFPGLRIPVLHTVFHRRAPRGHAGTVRSRGRGRTAGPLRAWRARPAVSRRRAPCGPPTCAGRGAGRSRSPRARP